MDPQSFPWMASIPAWVPWTLGSVASRGLLCLWRGGLSHVCVIVGASPRCDGMMALLLEAGRAARLQGQGWESWNVQGRRGLSAKGSGVREKLS